jgi:hypothetical protein
VAFITNSALTASEVKKTTRPPKNEAAIIATIQAKEERMLNELNISSHRNSNGFGIIMSALRLSSVSERKERI